MNSMKRRAYELDLLRVLALTAVICVHVCGSISRKLPVDSSEYITACIYKFACTWEIPVFVMISGRFFLDPDRRVDLKRCLKAIRRLVTAFVFWDFCYQFYYCLDGRYAGLCFWGILSEAVRGPYHFWFIYMICGLYVITPILRSIVLNKEAMELFILLFFGIEFLSVYGIMIPGFGNLISELLSIVNIQLVVGYSGLYMLGYYLHRYPLGRKYEMMLYLAGIAGLAFSISANLFSAFKAGEYVESFSCYLSTNVVIEACALYLLFVKRISRMRFSDRFKACIAGASYYSFGIYLVHALINEMVCSYCIDYLLILPALMVPLMTILVFTLSYLLAWFLSKVPLVKHSVL